MHEYSIVSALLERVGAEAARHAARRVTSVRLSVGELSGVDGELLASAFDLVRADTICAGARLELVPVAALWSCPACGAEISSGAALRCTTCAVPARLVAGDGIVLERLEMEADDDV